MDKKILLEIIRKQVKPATGCTEPVAIALACSRAAKELPDKPDQVHVQISKAFFKNASAVGIPNTGEKGILIAAALGTIVDEPKDQLRLLEDVSPRQLAIAKDMVSQKRVRAEFIEIDQSVYVKATVKTGKDTAVAVIANGHTNMILLEVNGKKVFESATDDVKDNKCGNIPKIGLTDILDAVDNMELDEISFLRDGIEMNMKMAEYGLNNKVGLGIGSGMWSLMNKGMICNDIINRIKMMVAAASDSRMGGVNMPVMTSCGSGNQGITAILPIALVADQHKKSEIELMRAIALSHLINVFVKQFMGKLSPICGCSVSAGLGATAGITWLLGGTREQIEGAMKSLIASLTGTLCDGAKESCSFKLETAAGEAAVYAFLALEDVYIKDEQGVVENSLENSIKNMQLVSEYGMQNADDAILKIITNRM